MGLHPLLRILPRGRRFASAESGRHTLLVKIVHFADLHLDSAFAWCGAAGDTARRRRQTLRNTLVAILELVREVDADALFCGGDLYEHDRVTPDTAAFLQGLFEDLAPIPVYIAPGNHDYHGPGSVYATVAWSSNVRIFSEPHLRREELTDGITLWGAAHCAPANTNGFLADFRAEGDGVHIALFHGAERSWLAGQGEGKQLHAAFDAADIERAGLHHAFLGHYHRPKDAARHTYPGNPDPLQFGEDGERGPIVATINPDGSIARERRSVAKSQTHDIALDVTGCASQQEVRNRLIELVKGLSSIARLTVHGDLKPSVDLPESALRDVLSETFDAAQLHWGEQLRSAHNIDFIKQEPTVRGQFVNDVLAAGLAPDEERRILVTGLRALEGRDNLEAP